MNGSASFDAFCAFHCSLTHAHTCFCSSLSVWWSINRSKSRCKRLWAKESDRNSWNIVVLSQEFSLRFFGSGANLVRLVPSSYPKCFISCEICPTCDLTVAIRLICPKQKQQITDEKKNMEISHLLHFLRVKSAVFDECWKICQLSPVPPEIPTDEPIYPPPTRQPL